MLATRVRRRSSRLMRGRPGRAQAHAVGGGEVEDHQTLRDGNFSPLGQLGVLLAPGFQRRLQEPLGLHLVRGIEDRAKCGGDGFSRLLPGDELASVLLELAALPGNRGQYRPAGCLEPCMVVSDDELDAMKPAGKQTLQEAPLIDLGFVRGHRATEHPALARGLDADGDQHGAIMDVAFQTHLLASAAAYAA
jgi:hypothetical protein